MSVNTAHGLPLLPGNAFRDTSRSAFPRPQTLTYGNGYALRGRPAVGGGQRAPSYGDTVQLAAQATDHVGARRFVPARAAHDKKVLRFYGYFRQEVHDSPDERWRIRPVVIYYYLEDDSMCVMEPEVENSGMPQGKLLKRHKLPKSQQGAVYHWKDLNVAMDLCVYGTVYRLTHCDPFTQEFMESQGIVLNDPEPTASDPYTSGRRKPQLYHITPSNYDNFKQFLTMDGKVLRFFALWDDSGSLYGEKRAVLLHFYLVDDTVEIREVQQPNSGREPVPLLLHRQRVSKRARAACQPFPSCVLEVSKQEVEEYYSPKDFRVGEELTLLGKRFLLYDCDAFTRKYYEQHHPEILLKPLPLDKKPQEYWKRVIPPYNGFGSLEDSVQNCLSLVPEPPKKNLIKALEKDHKVLRYAARLDSQNPQDRGRHFIISYFLANDAISIYETPKRNSGIIAGKFLEKTRIPKPGSTVDNPEYYSPADFAIGATVEVFRHRFVLTDADQYVLDYLESVSEQDQVPERTLSSLRQALRPGGALGPIRALEDPSEPTADEGIPASS
ncbi:EF-hand domain-containing protein 1 isoform X1 [Electrophorus electricus]|uniref:DM10 domain-containing protein n=1 Tax=Electrophorus electricus TaxID=8005 RepID=A0A4W4H0Q7_ELEEL|nr:EF-hand domain-containing protein 1 isoform X1 [Electrophorus electricus]